MSPKHSKIHILRILQNTLYLTSKQLLHGFHKHVKDKHISIWEKERMRERSEAREKKKEFLDKNFKTP